MTELALFREHFETFIEAQQDHWRELERSAAGLTDEALLEVLDTQASIAADIANTLRALIAVLYPPEHRRFPCITTNPVGTGDLTIPAGAMKVGDLITVTVHAVAEPLLSPAEYEEMLGRAVRRG